MDDTRRFQLLYGPYPPAAGRPFTPDEDALLGTDLDRVIASRIGGNLQTVAQRQKGLGIASWREQHCYRACKGR